MTSKRAAQGASGGLAVFVNNNLYLANCDSVHKRAHPEIRKRLVWGFLLARRIILTPPMLIDNPGLDGFFADPIIGRYLRAHSGKIILRHYHRADALSLVDYFQELDGGFIISSGTSGPCRKDQLSARERTALERRLARLDRLLDVANPLHERISIRPNALSEEIRGRLVAAEGLDLDLADRDRLGSQDGLRSRSHWYAYLQAQYATDPGRLERIRTEVVDPAYNSLSIRPGEAFAADNIPFLDLPGVELAAAVLAYEPEIQMCRAILRAARFIYSLGTDGLFRWARDAAVEKFRDTVQERLVEEGAASATWRGMMTECRRRIGIEIKPEEHRGGHADH
ncbi:MAG: hypothetical protein M0Z76_10730 [Gammaproteobacteria bacterium]|nr:hypothetical protein [Gammaproteobacteria bacterium]